MHEENTEKVEKDEELFWKTTCCICYGKFTVEVKTKCNHKFCSCCVTQIYHDARNDGKALQCPCCRGDLNNEVLEYQFTLHNNLAELSTGTIQNAFPMLPLCSNVTIDDILKWLECGIDVNYMNVFTALTSAATKGNLNVLNVLITNGANVESSTMFGQTPLMAAALYGHVDIIDALLKQKAEVNTKDLHGCSALHYASNIGNVAIMKLLIKSGKNLDIDTQTNQGLSALLLTSTSYGDLESMKLLIANGANVHKVSVEYGTPLHQVAAHGHLNKFKYLISETTIDINSPTPAGTTPLMLAIKEKQFELVKALLQEKAQVNAQRNDGLSALHFATASIKIFEILIEHGANINLKSDIYGTPMTRAAILGHLDVVKYLIEKKADINVKTATGETPLMAAAEHGYFEIVKALLQEKAEVNPQMNDGSSALHFAASQGHFEIVKALLEKKANVNAKTNKGSYALHFAAQLGHFEIVKELQKAKPELPVLKQRSDGQSALSLAELNGHTLIAEFLCEIADVQNEDEISTCVNKIFTNLYQHELLEDEHNIDEKNDEISIYVNKMFINLYKSLEEEKKETDVQNMVGKKTMHFLFWFMIMAIICDLFLKKV